ncbi:hypothetical protein MFIFM68171_10708 [Madurella fahalii]|uniref:Uncharacterized protein n=1 Tax=Madurella fahalii TaxID=1157608 RepID=A0ABQ0GRY1_9PEZI
MTLPPEWPKQLMQLGLTADEWLTEIFEDPANGRLAQQFRVSQVTHYKNTKAKSKWKHEFVVATLRNNSQDNRSNDACLYLRYERCWDDEDQESDDKLPSKLGNSSALSSILINQPKNRVDKLTPLSQVALKRLEKSVKAGETLRLRQMTFEAITPTAFDLAAVLKAHSQLSTTYRLHTTMCYWFAGSTYEVLERLYGGQNENLQHAKKAGKLGPITGYPGYRLMQAKEEAGDMRGLVNLVRSFEQGGEGKKQNEVPDAALREVEEELRQIPRFDRLCQLSRECRDQVVAIIEQREREERDRQEEAARDRAGRVAAEQQLVTTEQRLLAAEQQLAKEKAERVDMSKKHAEQMAARDRELDKLREQLGAQLPTVSSSK